MGIADWTEQERQEVLDFYRIDTLDPIQWIHSADQPFAEDQEESTAAAQLLGAQEDDLTVWCRALLQDTSDPLGVNDAAYVQQLRLREPAGGEEEAQQDKPPKRSISLASPNFHPRHFLRTVHRDTPHAALVKGIVHLQTSCAQRNETVKELVKQNFARFINAKNSVEAVYQDMQKRGLTSEDHGLKATADAMQTAFQKAQEVFQPLLVRRSQEELIRKRLRVYEKYSFILALGGKFERYLELGDYQQASYDYRKAKALLLDVQQADSAFRAVLEKTWNGHLAKVLGDLRAELFRKLGNPVYPYEVHAKMIEYLLELDARPDPATYYLEAVKAQHLNQIRTFRTRALDELALLKGSANSSSDFTRLVEHGRSQSVESLQAGTDVYAQAWRIRRSFFANLSGSFESFAPGFSRFTSAIFEGKLQSSDPQQSSTGDQLAVYIAKLRDFANELAEVMVSTSESVLEGEQNVLVGCAFAPVVLRSLQAIFVAADSAAMSDIMIESVKSVLMKTSQCLAQRLWTDAEADARQLAGSASFLVTGTDTIGQEGVDLASALIRAFEDLVQQLISTTSALQKTFAVEPFTSAELSLQPCLTEICPVGLTQIFFASVDGLKEMALQDDPEAGPLDDGLTMEGCEPERMGLSSLGTGYRLLIILTNITHMQAKTLEHTGAFFASAELGQLADDCQQRITEHLDLAHYHVGEIYLARRRGLLLSIIQNGFDSFNWTTTCTPPNLTLRPYIYRLLAELTAMQNEILDVAPPACLRALMSSAVRAAFKEFLAGVMNLRRVSPQAYMQVRLELDFLAERLVTAITPETDELVQEIGKILLELVGESEIPDVAPSLMAAMQDTSLQYSCFLYS